MNLLSVRKSILVEFLIAFAIVLIVRGGTIFGVAWSQDDYLQLYDPSAQGLIDVQFSMLRASGALITILMDWLGASHPTNGTLWSALHAGSMVVFGLALRQLWIPGSPSIYGIGNALIFSLFPAQSNLFSYQIMHPAMVANYGLGAFALVSYAKGGWQTMASILAISFVLGYQTMLGLLLVAAMILLAIRLTALVSDSGERAKKITKHLRPVATLLGCILAGVLLYVVANKLALVLVGTGQSSRAGLVTPDALGEKARFLFAHLKKLLYGRGEPSIPANTKLLQLMLLACVASASLAAAYRSIGLKLKAVVYLMAIGLVLLGAAALIMVPAILLSYTNDNPRIYMASAVFWAGVFSMSFPAYPATLRRIGLMLGILIVSSYAIITNSISVDFARLNQRELLIAGQMVERLAALPGYDRLRTVVLIGNSSQPNTDLRSKDMIWSSLNSSMATGVLREASGEPLANPSPADRDLALRVSKGMAPWPQPGSTAIEGDVGIVLFGTSR